MKNLKEIEIVRKRKSQYLTRTRGGNMSNNIPNDMSGQDFNHRDLCDRNLARFQFNGCDFSHTKLNGATLSESQLCGANFTQAMLCGIQLSKAKLNGSKFYQANLTGANLASADLRCADFRKADLSEANLSNAKVQGAQFQGCKGISNETKRNLKKQGAIFQSGDRLDIKWWVQYAIVPLTVALIGSNFLTGMIAPKNQPPAQQNSVYNVK